MNITNFILLLKDNPDNYYKDCPCRAHIAHRVVQL